MRQQSPWPRWDNLCCGLSHVFHRIPSPKYLTCSIGTWQRKRTQCRQRCGVGHAGAVSREDHLAVTKAFQCLADVVPATLAHPADMREVDFEGHPLAPVAGLVDHLAAGSADHQAPAAQAAGHLAADELATASGGAGAVDTLRRIVDVGARTRAGSGERE